MLMRFLTILSLACLLILASCDTVMPGVILPEEPVSTHSSTGAKEAALAYLSAWQEDDYSLMYRMLTSVSQAALRQDDLRKHYEGVSLEAALTGLDVEILSVLTNPQSAQVMYRVILHSALVGDISRDTEMNLSLENGDWRVQWDDGLVLPDLKGSNYLMMNRQNYIPARANIYDRNGNALVAQTDAVAIGLYPDQIDPAQQEVLFGELATLTGLSTEAIQSMFENFPKGKGWYLPIGQVTAEAIRDRLETLKGLSGLVLEPYRARYYFDGGVAPHVLGYTGPITPEEISKLALLGYGEDDRLGRSGLEKWGEAYLAGQRGGALYVVDGQGQPVNRLAEKLAQPGQAIVTTLDRDFQLGAQNAIAGFRGAVVVIERDSGRILAMVSSPGFDPNAFEPVNFNSESLQQTLLNPDQPLLNRATQGLYPLGSVFKTIVMAAALESGDFTLDSTLNCGYKFEELGPGAILYDWTYEYFLSDKKTKPSGPLTLSQGLVRSCNPWFYHIGLQLFRDGKRLLLSDLARGFGLGKPTGGVGVEEAAGNVPEPDTEYDATNLGIGQGDLLVTPLQVANFMAAIGNGGSLNRPQLVEAVIHPEGEVSYRFQSELLGKLPIAPETLKAIQEAMVGVVRSTKPVGTAWHQFTGLDINVAGKTGTATAGSGLPHAWFAGYTFEERPDQPDIAIAVVLENAGEGSAYAAPVFRRIVELYFSGQPQKLYWWESSYGNPSTPTPPSP